MKIKGKIVKGVQLASGSAKNCKYSNGTISLQRMTMKFYDDRYTAFSKKLDEMNIHNGTINVRLSYPIVFKNPDFFIKDLNWFPKYNESFAFFACKIKINGRYYDSLVYRPQPSQLSEHNKYTVEVLAPRIDSINYGDKIEIFIRDKKVKKLSFFQKIKLFFIKNPKEINDI